MDFAWPIGEEARLATFVAIGIAGFLATEPWRWFGVALAGWLPLDSEPFNWVKAVSTAIVAGLVMRMIFFPIGALAASSLYVRVASICIGIGVFYLTRKHLGAGILSGTVAFAAIQALFV